MVSRPLRGDSSPAGSRTGPLRDRLARVAVGAAALYILDRAAKLAALGAHLRRFAPPTPPQWPAATILHPITRATNGTSPLAANLGACARLDYPAPLRHLLICDAEDGESLATCRAFVAAHPDVNAAVITVPRGDGPVAPKIIKLISGLATLPATTRDEILCFIDDDIAPRPANLRDLVAALGPADSTIGASFGLPCYTNWRTPWSALLSGFNNANFPLASAALAFIAPPPRITGHLVAYRRVLFECAGGLAGLADQIDDDFAFARRLGAIGVSIRQTAVVYDVDNDLSSAASFARLLRRWFVLPRQAMAHNLTPGESASGLLVSLGFLLPPLIALLSALARRRSAVLALAATLSAHAAAAAATEKFLGNPKPPPPSRWWTMPIGAVALPLGALAATLFGSDEVEWRGQRFRIAPGGQFVRVE